MGEETMAAFALRLARMRASRGMSLRQVAEAAGVSPSTVMRAERGDDIAFSNAAQLAKGLGVTLAHMVTPHGCERCCDSPPAGFTCRACGAEGADGA